MKERKQKLDEIKRFNAAVIANKEMQSELLCISDDIGKIIAYANENGFKFTFDDIKKIMPESEVLSEDDLESVSGGLMQAALTGPAVLSRMIVF